MSAGFPDSREFLESIVDRVSVGIVVVDAQHTVARWNRFMAMHSGVAAEEAYGRNLFALFPELPERWLTQKLRSVFLLKNYAFTSWEQRPYLFRFPHNRPATAAVVDYMRQDCTFIPLKDPRDEVTHVCITVTDVTDTCIYQLQLEEAMASVRELSVRDSLTGTFNRGYIESRLQQEFARIHRHGGELSVILFDIDHFKEVNDTYGHMAGDDVLREVVVRTTTTVREDDICGRYGGEEFCVVLPNTPLEAAGAVAERLRHALCCEPVATSAGAIPISVTLGAARLNAHTPDHETLLNRADQALYSGKSGGRNRVTLYAQEE